MSLIKKLFAPIPGNEGNFLSINKLYYTIEVGICVVSFIIITFLPVSWISKAIIYVCLLALYKFFLFNLANFIFGDIGEKKVREILDQIQDIGVINDIQLPANKGNIDHIVFTHSGLFCIETKWKRPCKCYAYKREWYCNGKKLPKSPSSQVWSNTQLIKSFLLDNGIPKYIVLPGLVVLVGKIELVKKYEPLQIVNLRDLQKLIINIKNDIGNIDKNMVNRAYKLLKRYSHN
ncbi:MAG: nuclease-related domain-containing protein [Patescibacteria group bacterium]